MFQTQQGRRSFIRLNHQRNGCRGFPRRPFELLPPREPCLRNRPPAVLNAVGTQPPAAVPEELAGKGSSEVLRANGTKFVTVNSQLNPAETSYSCYGPPSTAAAGSMSPQTLMQAFMRVRTYFDSPITEQQQRRSGSSSRSSGIETQHWQCLVDQAMVLSEQLQPNQWSQIIYVCAKVGKPEPVLVQTALYHLHPSIHLLSPMGLTNSLWSIAVLSAKPSATLLSSYCAVATQNFSMLNPHQTATLLWSLGKLQYRPPIDLLRTLLSSLKKSYAMLSNTELSNIAWALGRLKFRPSKRWLRNYYHHTKPRLKTLNPHQLACTLASLVSIEVTPPNSWTISLLRSLQRQLPATALTQLSTILCALAKRRLVLSSYWVHHLLQHVQQQLLVHGAPTPAVAKDIAALVWSLPYLANPNGPQLGLNYRPLLQQLAAAVLPHLGRVGPGVLVQLVVGFAGLGFNPGVHWMKVHENACAARQAEMNPRNRERLRRAYLAI